MFNYTIAMKILMVAKAVYISISKCLRALCMQQFQQLYSLLMTCLKSARNLDLQVFSSVDGSEKIIL